MKQAGAEWNVMTEEEKKPYEKLHKKDQKRHDREVKEFKEKGYYTMADGTRSDEVHEPGKKKRASKGDDASASKAKSSRKKSAVKSKSGKQSEQPPSTIKKSGKKETEHKEAPGKENQEPVDDEHAHILFGENQQWSDSTATN